MTRGSGRIRAAPAPSLWRRIARRRPPAPVRLLESLMAAEWSGMKLGLDHFQRLLAHLGHPERVTPAVLVGGTNGKGSVAAMMAAVLRAAGYRTGLYSSPHLVSYRERIQIDGRPIRPSAVAAGMTEIGPAIERHGASFFEAMTALAMIHFARQAADIAVYEVGIGGALDATNAVPDPLVSVVVSVGLDHTEVLGPTLAHIARDKAGIARPQRPFVIGARGANRLLLGLEAKRRSAEPLLVGVDGKYRIEVLAATGSRFTYSSAGHAIRHLDLGLAGRHQVRNAACALLALGALPGYRVARGVRSGLRRVAWPGRLERVRPWLLVDGAHNADGARALAEHLRRFYADRPLVALAGMVEGKRPRSFARALGRAVGRVVVTEPASARRVPAAKLGLDFRAAGFQVAVEPDPKRALALARTSAGRGGLVVACGSLYLIGLILQLAGRRPLAGR
jgi:dihydrofolate synthase / folylpolyglutamate synthase